MDFQIIVHVRICPKVLFFIFFPHFAVMPEEFYAYLTNCVGVFRETGSVTYKKKVHVGQSFVPKKSSHEIS
jgi:hypothetical protein